MAARALPEPRWRVISIVGTRPEAIKMAPVVRALAAAGPIEQSIYLTGQHDGLAPIFAAFGQRCIALQIERRSLAVAQLRKRLTDGIAARLAGDRPDLVIVQGDTTSAFAGALAAERLGIAVAHVEAGLRSFDPAQPWPEEDNRIGIDRIAQLLFAPTDQAAANLRADAAVTGAVHVTGNSGIDALFAARTPFVGKAHADGLKTILVTCHRKENQHGALSDICAALRQLVAEFPVRVVFPLHPNRHLRARVRALLGDTPRISLIEPLDHGAMVAAIERAWIILTDSGGLQEEGPALGRPVLVLRNVTERVEAGSNAELVGTDPAAILRAVHRLLSSEVHYARMAQPALPFGDGRAAPRIAALIAGWLETQAIIVPA